MAPTRALASSILALLALLGATLGCGGHDVATGGMVDPARVAILPDAAAAGLAAHLNTSWRFVSLTSASAEQLGAASVFVPDWAEIQDPSAMVGALGRLPSGSLLQLLMTGFDTLDLASIPGRFTVCNVHNAGTAIPEYVIAAVLSWNVRLPQLDAEFRRCTWHEPPSACSRPPSHRETKGQTLGVVGFGAIGRGVAERAAALGMRVVAVEAHPPAATPPPLAWIGDDSMLPRLASEADFVVVSLPLAPATRGLLGPSVIAAMKPTGVLVNVGRGPIVDEEALYDALSGGRIGGAVLDVWWRRFESDSGTWPSSYNFSALPNVWMTPHTSFDTQEALEEALRQAAANFDALALGKPLSNVVRGPSGLDVSSAGAVTLL